VVRSTQDKAKSWSEKQFFFRDAATSIFLSYPLEHLTSINVTQIHTNYLAFVKTIHQRHLDRYKGVVLYSRVLPPPIYLSMSISSISHRRERQNLDCLENATINWPWRRRLFLQNDKGVKPRSYSKICRCLALASVNIGSDLSCMIISVPDPWHFGVDPDPDPRIHASD